MDNLASHCTDSVKAVESALGTDTILLPPNTTSMLQPLDSTLNHNFKDAVSECWRQWWQSVGHKNLTPKGNPRRAPLTEMKKWVVTAWEKLEPQTIVNCWSHTLNGQHVLDEAEERLAARAAAGTDLASDATPALVPVPVVNVDTGRAAAADEEDEVMYYDDVIVDADSDD